MRVLHYSLSMSMLCILLILLRAQLPAVDPGAPDEASERVIEASGRVGHVLHGSQQGPIYKLIEYIDNG